MNYNAVIADLNAEAKDAKGEPRARGPVDQVPAMLVRQPDNRSFVQKVQWIFDHDFRKPPVAKYYFMKKILICCQIEAVNLLVALLKKYFPEKFQQLDQQAIDLIKFSILYQHLNLDIAVFAADMFAFGYAKEKIDVVATAVDSIHVQLAEDACTLVPDIENSEPAVTNDCHHLQALAKQELMGDILILFKQEMWEIRQYWEGLFSFLLPSSHPYALDYCAKQGNFLVAIQDCIHLYRIWFVFAIFPPDDPGHYVGEEWAYFRHLFESLLSIQARFPIEVLALYNPTHSLAAQLLAPCEKRIKAYDEKIDRNPPCIKCFAEFNTKVGKRYEVDLMHCLIKNADEIDDEQEIMEAILSGDAFILTVYQGKNAKETARMAIFFNILYMLQHGCMLGFLDAVRKEVLTIDKVLRWAQINEKPLLPLAKLQRLGVIHHGPNYEKNYLAPSFNHLYGITFFPSEEKVEAKTSCYEFRFNKNDFDFECRTRMSIPNRLRTAKVLSDKDAQVARVYMLSDIEIFEREGDRYYDMRKIGQEAKGLYFQEYIGYCQQIFDCLKKCFHLGCGYNNLWLTVKMSQAQAILQLQFVATSTKMAPADFLEFIGMGKLDISKFGIEINQASGLSSMVVNNPPPIANILARLGELRQKVLDYLAAKQREFSQSSTMPKSPQGIKDASLPIPVSSSTQDQSVPEKFFPQEPFDILIVAIALQQDGLIDILFCRLADLVNTLERFTELAQTLLLSPRKGQLLAQLLLHAHNKIPGIKWQNLSRVLDVVLCHAVQTKNIVLLKIITKHIVYYRILSQQQIVIAVHALVAANCNVLEVVAEQIGFVLCAILKEMNAVKGQEKTVADEKVVAKARELNAAELGNLAITILKQYKDVVVTYADKNGNTGLHYVVQCNPINQELLTQVLHRHADPFACNGKNVTPFQLVLQRAEKAQDYVGLITFLLYGHNFAAINYAQGLDILIKGKQTLAKFFSPCDLGMFINTLLERLKDFRLISPPAKPAKPMCELANGGSMPNAPDLTVLRADAKIAQQDGVKQSTQMHPDADFLLTTSILILSDYDKIDIDVTIDPSKNTALHWALDCELPLKEQEALFTLIVRRHRANVRVVGDSGKTAADRMQGWSCAHHNRAFMDIVSLSPQQPNIVRLAPAVDTISSNIDLSCARYHRFS